MLLALTLSISSFASDAAPTCQEVQAGLQATVQVVSKGKKASTPAPAATYTGMCRPDVQFQNAPAPGDIVTTLDNLRGILANCLPEGETSANLMLEMRMYSDSTYAVVVPDSHPGQYCMRKVIDEVNFPEPVGSPSSYTVSWHFVHPVDLEALLGPMPAPVPVALPDVHRGVPEIGNDP